MINLIRTCLKCGHTTEHRLKYLGTLDRSYERLLVTCPVCGFEDIEQCADARAPVDD